MMRILGAIELRCSGIGSNSPTACSATNIWTTHGQTALDKFAEYLPLIIAIILPWAAAMWAARKILKISRLRGA